MGERFSQSCSQMWEGTHGGSDGRQQPQSPKVCWKVAQPVPGNALHLGCVLSALWSPVSVPGTVAGCFIEQRHLYYFLFYQGQ